VSLYHFLGICKVDLLMASLCRHGDVVCQMVRFVLPRVLRLPLATFLGKVADRRHSVYKRGTDQSIAGSGWGCGLGPGGVGISSGGPVRGLYRAPLSRNARAITADRNDLIRIPRRRAWVSRDSMGRGL